MAILRLCITKNNKKWKEIEDALLVKNNARGRQQKGSGLNGYIASEIHKRYSRKNLEDCEGIKVIRTRKDFQIEVPSDVLEKIKCEAKNESISLATLISKFILDPLIYPPTE